MWSEHVIPISAIVAFKQPKLDREVSKPKILQNVVQIIHLTQFFLKILQKNIPVNSSFVATDKALPQL